MKVTYVTMRMTDGKTTIYDVLQGHLRKNGTILYADSKRVATLRDDTSIFCYRCTEEVYATVEAPPVPWASHFHSCMLRAPCPNGHKCPVLV